MLEECHIMPFKMHNTQRARDWTQMESFWGRKRVLEWKGEILADNERMNTEQIRNLIVFSGYVHDCWDRCLCAFRPIEVNEEKTRMDIAFHWLPLLDDKVKRTDLVSSLENPYSAYDPHGGTPGNNNYVFDLVTQRAIPSGYIFTVKTDDPVKRPLPSFALLQMQWNLHRIAAMQGAGEDDDSDIDSDGDSVAVPSRSRSPIKDWRAENTAPSRSPTRSRSPAKLRGLSPGQLFER
jgi:hypothetical protein